MATDKAKITFYTTEELKQEVKLMAKEDMRSVSAVMNIIIMDYIRRREAKELEGK